ncbi:MAG: triose-phosphate isomerase [Bacillota bacterium]|nr:triose-phosphate isomerase [Bacillota bacterium]
MKLLIAANWKMHKTVAETEEYCRSIIVEEKLFGDVDIVICPPFTALFSAAEVLKNSSIKLGAQNIHWAEKGAYTGEISSAMLFELGIEYVIIGHSERRRLMAESDQQIHDKIAAALSYGLKPILCVGESESERNRGTTDHVIEKQLKSALVGIDQAKTSGLVIAYEPIWAIGTGKAATAEDAENAARYIRSKVENLLGSRITGELRVQYGGSVNSENIGSFVELPSVHGALVGGASLEADSFSTLVQAARKAVHN